MLTFPTMITRNYPKIKSFLARQQSVLVLGPRGTGKTYYLSRLLNDFRRTETIDLLNKEVFRNYLSDPSRLYKEIEQSLRLDPTPIVVMIDEVQLLPNLLDEVHRTIENFKPKVAFLLTGSSARKLKREDANLLAGRALKMDFFPLGLDEIQFESHLPSILQWGTLPTVVAEEDLEIRESYLNTYVGTYLIEEIQKEAQIRNLEGFSRFLEIAAAENGQSVNFSRLGRAAHIADVTIKEYFQILCDTLLAFHVPAWSFSKREQLQLSPKYYIFDNGVINSLLGELKSTPRPSTYKFGRLFENLVVGQLFQYRAKNNLSASIYHYRLKKGKEIDLIVQRNPNSAPVAVEIKSANNLSAEEVKQLISFKQTYPDSSVLVICRTDKAYVDQGIEFFGLTDGVQRVFELAEIG